MGKAARLRLLAICLIAASSGCTALTPSPAGPTIVVLQSPDLPDGLSVVSPAVLGLNLALEGSPVGLRVLAADVAGEAARRAAADPSVIGVVVAPFTLVGPTAVATLASAGVPVLSLSALQAPPPDSVRWWRLVPGAGGMAEAIVTVAEAEATSGCILSEIGRWSEEMGAAIEDAAQGTGYRRASDPTACDALIWSGSAAGAAALRTAYRGPMVLTDQARTDAYLSTPGAATTVGVCGCRDLSSSARPADQAFLHDYQEATGLDAGPYAAEGYDAGMMILRAASAAATRSELASGLASLGRYTGVAGPYPMGPDTDPGRLRVRIYRGEGVRWLPAG